MKIKSVIVESLSLLTAPVVLVSCAHCTVHGCTEPKETDGIDPGVSVCFKTHQHR